MENRAGCPEAHDGGASRTGASRAAELASQTQGALAAAEFSSMLRESLFSEGENTTSCNNSGRVSGRTEDRCSDTLEKLETIGAAAEQTRTPRRLCVSSLLGVYNSPLGMQKGVPQMQESEEALQPVQGHSGKDCSSGASPSTLSDIGVLPLVEAVSLSPLPALLYMEKRESGCDCCVSDSGNCKFNAATRGEACCSVRRCSSSGAAPDHVAGSRHSSSGLLKETAKHLRALHIDLCCSRQPSGEPLCFPPSRSSKYSGSSGRGCSGRRPTLSPQSSKLSSTSNSRQSLPWLRQRHFSFSGVMTHSLWDTRICPCRPSPVAGTHRSCSTSALTLQFEPSEPLGAHPGCLQESVGRASARHAEAACVLEFDDPLVRLESLRLQHQPRSPLMLLRCCSSPVADLLQQTNGDSCPSVADASCSSARGGGSFEISGASGAVEIPASGVPSLESASQAAVEAFPCRSLPIAVLLESCYGFLWGADLSARVEAYEAKTAPQRRKQAQLWEALLAADPTLSDRKMVKQLVRRGIPDHLRQALLHCRGKVWAVFLGADALLDSDPGAFERLQQEQLPRDVSGQIEVDLPRTFPSNKRFRCNNGICALRRVLRGFAAARPAVGYCQGLNFLAATMLLFQKEELALASLLQLVVSTDKDKGLQIGRYYTSGMADLRRDMKVLEILIRQKAPRVYQVLKKTGVEVEWIAAEWFLCLFSTSCPEPTVLRIWDCLILEGPKILFRVALGVIFFFEGQLAKMQSLEQVMGSLKGKLSLLVEHNELLHQCFNRLRRFPRRKLQQLQQTVAAGLADPCRCSLHLQQQPPEEEQQQDSRRRRLLSFKRLSRQRSACEEVQPRMQQSLATWRKRLSMVSSRVAIRRKGGASTGQGGFSFFGGSHLPDRSGTGSLLDCSARQMHPPSTRGELASVSADPQHYALLACSRGERMTFPNSRFSALRDGGEAEGTEGEGREAAAP
ncbi:uncharacterized protein LOC34623527 [Cyclospora cayetanensis]|uniref:Uncharacterized protein LOC34623527 n=1 Tax=Cyclospora cayetanensis TaxID=88456 RepID=A0A6P6RSU3_9EIME|nr:uncharacterized protein LOC34623527 [Cyclospora cayetanensis]